MEYLELLLQMLFVVFLLYIAIVTIVSMNRVDDYSDYIQIYYVLQHMHFVKNHNHVYGILNAKDSKSWLCYYVDRGRILIGFDTFLVNYGIFDPIGLYYERRYKKWFKDNVNIDNLPLFIEAE